MRVLHLISSGGMYGAEAVILDLSRTLSQSDHTATLCVFATPGQDNAELLRRAGLQGLETHILPCSGQLDRTLARRLRAVAKTTGADIVHAHGYKADVYAFWALRRSGVAMVSTCHTWYDNDFFLRLYGAIDRAVLRRFHAVVAVSEEVESRLLGSGVRRERIRSIRNGIDMSSFANRQLAPRSAGPFLDPTVGLVGRFAPEKGIDLFLRAAALVRESIPGARFLVGGDGPDRAPLEALVAELGLLEAVTLPGRRENMPAFYGTLDLLVSASRQEGLPIALLEGMASGLPVVATRVGEIPKLVEDGRTGILVSPEDPTALAEAIIALLRDGDRRRAFGSNARLRVAQEYSADRMSAEYLAVYEQAIREAAR